MALLIRSVILLVQIQRFHKVLFCKQELIKNKLSIGLWLNGFSSIAIR